VRYRSAVRAVSQVSFAVRPLGEGQALYRRFMKISQRNLMIFEFFVYISFLLFGLCVGVRQGSRHGLLGEIFGAIGGLIIALFVWVALLMTVNAIHQRINRAQKIKPH
jgi:hypothetical protein